MRLRVICTSPSSLILRMLLRVLSFLKASRSASVTLLRLAARSMSMKSMMMSPPMLRSRSCSTHDLGCLQIGLQHGLFLVSFSYEAASVHVNGSESFGMVDDDMATGFKVYSAIEALW